MKFDRIVGWIKARPKNVIEIIIFLSLGLAIFCFIQELETLGRWLLAFFFISFILLLLHDLIHYIVKKIRKN